jgi:hypothetical protein
LTGRERQLNLGFGEVIELPGRLLAGVAYTNKIQIQAMSDVLPIGRGKQVVQHRKLGQRRH